MSQDSLIANELRKSKSKKTPQTKAGTAAKKVNNTTSTALKSVSKPASIVAPPKQETTEKLTTEVTNDGSKTDKDDRGDKANAPSVIQWSNRSVNEENIVKGNASEKKILDIPTISMEDADDESTIDLQPQVADAPQFSVNQMPTFIDIEKNFIRERTSKYLNPLIDIGILYQELHLNEDFEDDELKLWNWDKIFVEIRNAITHPNTGQ